MPGDPTECRNHALRCLELAKSATSPQAKAKFPTASSWTHLATDLVAMGVLIETEKTESKRPAKPPAENDGRGGSRRPEGACANERGTCAAQDIFSG